MQSRDQSLQQLVRMGRLSLEEARKWVSDPQQLVVSRLAST